MPTVLSGPLGAQWRADAGLGVARITQPESPVRSAATVNGSLVWLRTSAAVAGSGGLTLPSGGGARMQGELGASVRSDARRRATIEATGVVSAYEESRFPLMLSGFAGLRAHVRAGRVGAWAGAAAGTLDDGAFTYPHTLWEAGLASSWRSVRVTASATRNRTLGEPRIEFLGDPPLQVTVRDGLRYTDAVVAMEARPRQLEIDGRLARRSVQQTIAYEELPPARVFGTASAAWWMTPRLALAGSFGHELADLARGLPEARHATLGLRIRLHDAAPATSRPVSRRRVITGAAPDVLIERGGTQGVTLRVLASATVRTIEVAGTFSEWEPLRLYSDGGGAWSLATPIPAGQHRVMIRVDGGVWMPPANLPSVDDEVGGRVGLFTVAGPG